MEIVEIPLKEILEDFFFCFTSASDSYLLKRSIRESGIRSPLRVVRTEQGYRLFSGFKRYRVATELKLRSVPVTVCSEEIPLREVFRDVLLGHLSCRSLSLVEKARVLRILGELDVSWESLRTDFLPLLDLPEESKVVQEVKDLLAFPAAVQEYIEKYGLSLKQTRMFAKLSPKQQELFIRLGTGLQIRAVELSEIISLFYDIVGREAIPMEQVYDELGIDALLENSEFSRNEKILQIKRELYKRRYPRLSSWNESLERWKKEMTLSEKIRLSWDRSLEAPGIVLRTEIRSVEDVEEIAALLSKEENRRRFEEMLKVV